MAVKTQQIAAGDKNLLSVGLGRRTSFELNRKLQNHALAVRLTGDVSISAGTTSGTVRNGGSLWSFIRRLVLEEQSTARWDLPGKVVQFVHQILARGTLQGFTRLLNGDVQANTLLNETAILHFALPFIARPSETVFVERNPDLPLRLKLETFESPFAEVIEGGDRTLALNALDAEVIQLADPFTDTRRFPPEFLPVFKEIASEPITGTVTDHQIKLDPEHGVAMFIVVTESDGFLVDDVISKLEFKGNFAPLMEGKQSIGTVKEMAEAAFPGDAFEDGIYPFNVVDGGLLTNRLLPSQEPNLNLLVDAAPSAVVAGSTVVRVFALQLENIPGLTNALQRRNSGNGNGNG